MPVLVGAGHDVLQDPFVTGDVCLGHGLPDDDRPHSLGVEEGTGALESLYVHISIFLTSIGGEMYSPVPQLADP